MLLELKNITKEYRQKGKANVKALDNVSMTVDSGEMVAITGSSGAGKSTLLHMLGCLDVPTYGEYYYSGEELSRKNNTYLSHLRNQKFGFVVQNFALIEDDSVEDNVAVPMLFAKKSFSQIEKGTRLILEQCGVVHLAKRKVKKLSGGEKQRVAIARALANDPEIIFADEPTGALDQKNAKMIMDIFVQMCERGKTIIIVTHEQFVAQMCQRRIVVSDGKIVDDCNT